MKPLKLAIANKNYSSWSMRPWVLLTQAGIAFEEIQLKFSDSGKVAGTEPYSPTRQVPVLIVDGEPVWDSLAIGEAVAEMFPHKHLWPADPRARQIARSICAEMHAGVRNLRGAMPVKKSSAHIAITTKNSFSIFPSRPQLTSSSLFIPVTPD